MQVACSRYIELCVGKEAHTLYVTYNEGQLSQQSRLKPFTTPPTTLPFFGVFCCNTNTLCHSSNVHTLQKHPRVFHHLWPQSLRYISEQQILYNAWNDLSQLISFSFQNDSTLYWIYIHVWNRCCPWFLEAYKYITNLLFLFWGGSLLFFFGSVFLQDLFFS